MSSATENSVTVTFDPTAINKQSDILFPVSSSKAGVMIPSMLSALETGVALENVDIYVNDVTGDDANPGTSALPVQTLARAFELLPAGWRKTAHINLSAGSFTFPSNGVMFGRPSGPDGAPLILIGTPVAVESLTESSGGSTSVITDAGAGMTVDEFVGAEVLCTSGANAGQAISVRRNTATTVTLNGLFLAPVGIGDTFEIRRPNSTITFPAHVAIFQSRVSMAHVKLSGFVDFIQCQLDSMRNVEFAIPDVGSPNVCDFQESLLVSAGFGPGGAWDSDPTAPFSFFSFQSGVYVHGASAVNSGVVMAQTAVRASFLVCRDAFIVSSGGTPIFQGLGILDGALLSVFGNAMQVAPNGIFGFYPSQLDGSYHTVTSAKSELIFPDISNSPQDAIMAENNANVITVGVTGTGNTGYGILVKEMSQAFARFGTSVTGTLGDTLVGAVPKAYGALPFSEVDGSGPTLNRIQ